MKLRKFWKRKELKTQGEDLGFVWYVEWPRAYAWLFRIPTAMGKGIINKGQVN